VAAQAAFDLRWSWTIVVLAVVGITVAVVLAVGW
jgi:hypothetical protein